MIGSGVFLLPASLAPYGLNSIFGWIFTRERRRAARDRVRAAVARLSASRRPVHLSARRLRRVLRLRHGVGLLDVGVGRQRRDRDRQRRLPRPSWCPRSSTTKGAPALTAVALIWILTFVNWRGVKQAGVFQLVTTVLKVHAAARGHRPRDRAARGAATQSLIKVEPQPFSISAMTAAATLTLWALLGLESATVPADNVIDPKRNIPRATLWGTVVTALIYVVACSAVILLIPGSQLAGFERAVRGR